MYQANLFIIVFLITLITIRIAVYLKPIPSPTSKGFRMHHYMYGIVLIPISILTNSIILFGIGTALFFDELTFLLIGGKTHKDNYSATSIMGTIGFAIILFIFRDFLLSKLFRI